MTRKRKQTAELSSSRTRKTRSMVAPQPPPEQQFDSSRFLSLYHEQHFNNNLIRKDIIRERGIQLEVRQCSKIRKEILRRGWLNLVATLTEGCRTLVREFYANAVQKEKKDQLEYNSFVRGKEICYNADIINAMFGTTPEGDEDDTYDDLINSVWDPELILKELCLDGATWVTTKNSGKPRVLWKASMKPIPKEKYIDVGKLIASNILKVAHEPKTRLGYPNLITSMIKAAGVTTPILDRIKPLPPITAVNIKQVMDAAPTEFQPTPRAPEHRVPLATSVRLTVQVTQMMLRRLYSHQRLMEDFIKFMRYPEDRIVPVEPLNEVERAYLQLDSNEAGTQDVSEDANSEVSDSEEDEDEDGAATADSEEE